MRLSPRRPVPGTRTYWALILATPLPQRAYLPGRLRWDSPDEAKGASAPHAAIELVGIDKRFGAVQANRASTSPSRKGTIHGIVGENGAGKST